MTYRAPVRDIALALQVAGHPALAAQAFPGLDDDTVTAVLAAAADFTESELAPLNRGGDLVGASYANGAVTAAPGFAQAFKAYAAGGWPGLSAEPDHGGQGLSKALDVSVMEMVSAANMAFGLCPMLTQGATEALVAQGTERQKRMVLPKLVSGEWTGTMNLTEPGAGSDLAAVTTRAQPDGAGGYRLTGQKIFITWGDHDMADNICHLVLARLPDAPPGVKGISLFLAPKRLIDAEGRAGAPNALRPASIEHKLGIHGSPTCVMLFEDAQAELVGTANEGLAHMFVMMNAARLQVGVQGVAIAERAFQQALAYTQERRQGRAPWSADYPAVIYDHPDVRRTLMLMKARIEAGRGICLVNAVQADLARLAPTDEARAAARARQELTTPIAKGWCTDMGVEVASLGVQVHGGMGFIEETGAAQTLRDVRITAIYEGTTGIQSNDLIGRKFGRDRGAALGVFIDEMRASLTALTPTSRAGTQTRDAALESLGHLRKSADALLAVLATAPDRAMAVSVPFLKMCALTIGGWLLARSSDIAARQLAGGAADREFLEGKIATAHFYATQVLPRTLALEQIVIHGGDAVAGTDASLI